MLMDEPFGAIDPVVRADIQDEFLRMQQHVRKTIIIVTHDIDEAIKMGDRIAVLRDGGVLAQFGSPAELLAAPNSDFVARFIGADSALKRLSLHHVGDMQIISLAEAASQGYVLYVDATGRPTHWGSGTPATPLVRADATLRDALSQLLAAGTYFAPVVDAAGMPLGVISADIIQAALRPPAPAEPVAHMPFATTHLTGHPSQAAAG
jgi:osmoprotectant transport system ATP-binding protein